MKAFIRILMITLWFLGQCAYSSELLEMMSRRSLKEWESYRKEESLSSQNKRCQEELHLKELPLSCFSIKEGSVLNDFINRMCIDAVENSDSIDLLMELLVRKEVAVSCRQRAQQRISILIYKLEEKSPDQVFGYLRRLEDGPYFEKTLRDETKYSDQSNGVQFTLSSGRRSK